MTPTDIAASAAIGLSTIAMLACVVAIPTIFKIGYDIQNELHEDMSEFRTLSDEAWTNMMAKPRKARTTPPVDNGHCHCYDRRSFCVTLRTAILIVHIFRKPLPSRPARTTRPSRRQWRAGC